MDASSPSEPLKITNSEELEAWLKDKPREVCVTLAMRSALRVLPLWRLIRLEKHFNLEKDMYLPLFHCALTTPFYDAPAINAKAHTLKAHTLTDILRNQNSANLQNSANRSALATALTTTTAIISLLSSDVGHATRVIYLAVQSAELSQFLGINTYARTAMLRSISRDIFAFDSGRHSEEIHAFPLWVDENGEAYVNSWFQKAWQEFKNKLSGYNNGWQIWIDWYERRLKGAPFTAEEQAKDRAFIRALEDLDLWQEPDAQGNIGQGHNREPAIVNARIQALIDEELSKLEKHEEGDIPQKPYAPHFSVNIEGKIALSPPPSGATLEDVGDSFLFYEEWRYKIQTLHKKGHNILGETCTNQLERILEVADLNPSLTSVPRLWSRFNTLRTTLKKHEIVALLDEPHPDKLDTGVAEELKDAMRTWNQLAFAELKLRAYETRQPPDEEVEAIKHQIALAQPIIAGIKAQADQLAEPDASDELERANEGRTLNDDSFHGKQQQLLTRDTNHNFIATLLNGAIKHLRLKGGDVSKAIVGGVYGNVATALVGFDVKDLIIHCTPYAFEFIANLSINFKAYVAAAYPQFPHLKQLIDHIVIYVNSRKK